MGALHHGDSGSPQEGKDGDGVGEHLEGAADHHVHVQVAGDQLALKKNIFKRSFSRASCKRRI